jgi:hypothetical protein
LPDINHEQIHRLCRGLAKVDVSAMGADEQSLDYAFTAERRIRRGIFVERRMMESEHRRCDIIPGLKRTNMSLHTEPGFTVAPDCTDAAPAVLPEVACVAGA